MSLWEFFSEHFETLPLMVNPDTCRGGTYIVTGANIGLGLETARHLVAADAKHVILAVRSLRAGEHAKADIEKSTGRTNVAQVWPLDLASYDSVRAFARRCLAAFERVDALVLNASVAMAEFTVADGGSETSVVVNDYSTFLLAVMLLPRMVEGGRRFGIRPRLVVVSSGVGFWVREEFERIKGDLFGVLDEVGGSDMVHRYGLTKLIQIYGTKELASLLPVEKTGVVITYISPGLCRTALIRNAGLWRWLQLKLWHLLLGRTAEMGSRAVLHGVVATESEHGHYLSGCRVKEHWAPDWSKDEEAMRMQKVVWNGLVKKIEEIEPGCVDRILKI